MATLASIDVGWIEFAGAFVAFLVSHIVPARPQNRRRLVAALGTRGYGVVYGAMSIVMLTWLIIAAHRAPYVMLWEPAAWQRWVPFLAMLPACLIAALSVGRPNPFSFGGGDHAAFDASRPGIVGLTRHPVLWALALWAGAHVIPNGDLAHVLLFGGSALFAALGTLSFDRRRQQALGRAHWQSLDGMRQAAGFRLSDPDGLSANLRRLAAGVVIYVVLLLLHAHVIGVSPWPVGLPV